MSAHVKDMTHGSPARLITGFALPLMLGNVFQQLYTTVDTAIVGQFAGIEALAALGAADGEELGKRIRSILDRSGQPSTLKEWGVKREDLPRMASLGLTKGRADNNPLDIDEAMILEILEEIYD